MKDEPRNPSCELLRRDLELFAEAELSEPLARDRVRRHLAGCPDCRSYLVAYDRHTAAILAEAQCDVEHSARIDRIMERLIRLPREPASKTPRVAAPVPGASMLVSHLQVFPQREGSRRSLSWGLLAAAALLLAMTAGFCLFHGSTAPTGPGIVSEESSTDLLPEQPTIAALQQPPARERRWVLDESLGTGHSAALAPSRSMRLYGFDLFEESHEGENASNGRAADSEVSVPAESGGWVVDATAQGSLRSSDRAHYYLVPDGSAAAVAEPMEIDPISWRRSSPGGGMPPLARQGKATFYRVIMLPSARILGEHQLPPQFQYTSNSPGWNVLGRTPQAWVTPAVWGQ